MFDIRRGGAASWTGRILNGVYDFVAPAVDAVVPGASEIVGLVRSCAEGGRLK